MYEKTIAKSLFGDFVFFSTGVEVISKSPVSLRYSEASIFFITMSNLILKGLAGY